MNEVYAGIKRFEIVRIIPETINAKTFVIKFLDEWQPVYLPGQFITLVFFTRHGEKRRSYSISSLQSIGEPCSFTVKWVENGEFSRFLFSHIKVGDVLFSSGISGHFILPEDTDSIKQFFFLAAGSGITPCFAMIRHLLATSRVSIILIYSNKNTEGCIFYNQLEMLKEKFRDRFTINYLFSELLDVYRSRLSKWLLLQLLEKYIDAPVEKIQFYLCGPFEYMRMITITLLERIPAKNIFRENFLTLPPLVMQRPPDTNAHEVTIHINGDIKTISVQFPDSILAAAKSHQICLPYSCEAGRCGSCMATCTRGKIWMAYNEVLTDEEIKEGRVLTCQSFPIEGDVTIEFI